MKRSQINPMPEYYDRLINLVADVELSTAFEESIKQLDGLDRNYIASFEWRTYETGKWTVKEILQHLIDFERILSYRSMLFARDEGSIAQSIDQDLLVINSRANARTIDSFIDELKTLRRATLLLYESFDSEALLKTGINWKYEISVLAMGFAMIGHQIHHMRVIEERYFPLIARDMSNANVSR